MGSPKVESSKESRVVVGLDRRQLLERHLKGDPVAFSELIGFYRAPVYAYLMRCGVAPSACDDLFQEVFLKIHRGASSYRSNRPLDPWLFTIVANTVRSYYRTQRVRELVYQDEVPPEAEDRNCEHDAHEVHSTIEAKETADWLSEALKKLSFAEREVILLFCIQSLSLKETAKALDMPLNTVKTHLRRGRMALARALIKRNARLRREVSKC